MAFFGEPSILERRQAVTDVQDSQRQERNLFKRAFRQANRLSRRSKNPQHTLQALSIRDAAASRGYDAVGISSFDQGRNFAQNTLSNFYRDNQLARAQMRTPAAGPAANPAASNPTVAVPAAASTTAQNNGGGGFSALDAANQPVAADQTSTFEGRDAVGRGTINGRPTDEVIGAPKEAGIYEEFEGAPGVNVKMRKSEITGKYIPENAVELDDGTVVTANSKEAKQKALFDRLEEIEAGGFNLGESRASGERLQGKLDLLDRVNSGEVDPRTLTDKQKADVEEAEDFRLYIKEKEEFGQEEAASRHAERKMAREASRKRTREAFEAQRKAGFGDLPPLTTGLPDRRGKPTLVN